MTHFQYLSDHQPSNTSFEQTSFGSGLDSNPTGSSSCAQQANQPQPMYHHSSNGQNMHPQSMGQQLHNQQEQSRLKAVAEANRKRKYSFT